MSDIDEPKHPASPTQNLEVEVDKECLDSPLPDASTTPEINELDQSLQRRKDSHEEKHFTTIEGDLLDFEDFNEKPVDNDQIVDTKNSESEDGQCATPEKNVQKDESIEEGEDEGACSEDEDLEEGEISPEKKENSQPAVCRFYHRGMCFYGSACRFLHPNDKTGNYNMFDQMPRVYPDSYSRMSTMMTHRSTVSFVPSPPQPGYEIESAWERGLKEAKVLLKQANKRKDEPDFEEKRLNMSLGSKKHSDFDKENNSSPKRERRKRSRERRDNFRYREINNYDEDFNPYSKEPYPRVYQDEKVSRERSKFSKSSVERYSKDSRQRNTSHMEDTRMQKSDDVHKYFDPWQRSRSPIRNRTSRSVSCSPVSSYSYSSRSSRSSYASSRKTSSSRSRSRSRTPSHSISMDSVSSASSQNSSASHSSGSPTLRQRNTHISHRKAKPSIGRPDAVAGLRPKSPPVTKVKVESLDDDRDFLEENFQVPNDGTSIPHLQHLIPDFPERPREPVRGLNKHPIRLTLLNKNPQPKDLEAIKKTELAKSNLQRATKRPLSPPTVTKPAPVPAKKSASSRRDDLLKQLKAVEDAIARKRAKC